MNDLNNLNNQIKNLHFEIYKLITEDLSDSILKEISTKKQELIKFKEQVNQMK